MNHSRRSHPKTRTGCKTCKTRKIKCDEQRPSCRNCIRHSVQCDYLNSQPSSAHSSPGIYANPSPLGSGSTTTSSSQTVHPDGLLPSPNMLELELMHNFCTSTCYTLPTNSALRTLWRVNVPQLALSHEFVLRCLFAISALHLAHCRPEKRDFYIAQAMLQHNTGLRLVEPVLSNLTEENCAALFTFSILTYHVAMAKPRQSDDFLLFDESRISEWLFLLRGTRHISTLTIEALKRGPLAPMLLSGSRRAELVLSQTQQHESLADLLAMLQETLSDKSLLKIYSESIEELSQSFAAVFDDKVSPLVTTDIFIWPYRISDEFLELLTKPTQEALSILAFFAVLLHTLNSYWWAEGWATDLVSKIYYMLEEEYRLWIRWPMEQIGWLPSH